MKREHEIGTKSDDKISWSWRAARKMDQKRSASERSATDLVRSPHQLRKRARQTRGGFVADGEQLLATDQCSRDDERKPLRRRPVGIAHVGGQHAHGRGAQ